MIMVLIGKPCPECGKPHKVNATLEQCVKYVNNEDLVQNIFPELSPGEREYLITGYCEECWNKMFGNSKNLN